MKKKFYIALIFLLFIIFLPEAQPRRRSRGSTRSGGSSSNSLIFMILHIIILAFGVLNLTYQILKVCGCFKDPADALRKEINDRIKVQTLIKPFNPGNTKYHGFYLKNG